MSVMLEEPVTPAAPPPDEQPVTTPAIPRPAPPAQPARTPVPASTVTLADRLAELGIPVLDGSAVAAYQQRMILRLRRRTGKVCEFSWQMAGCSWIVAIVALFIMDVREPYATLIAVASLSLTIIAVISLIVAMMATRPAWVERSWETNFRRFTAPPTIWRLVARIREELPDSSIQLRILGLDPIVVVYWHGHSQPVAVFQYWRVIRLR